MLSAGMLLAFQQAAPAVEDPKARGWDDFPVFVWREKYAGKPLPEELVEPFGGVILMREEDSSWARARGLSYLVWNVAGRDALHLDADEAWNARVEQWIQTHDEKLLVREPCLNDPKTVEQLCATLDATIAKHGAHPGLGFVLGDEVGLTPNGDPFDLCRCELCEAKWKEYAQKNGLPERAPLTDEVRLALLEDDLSLLGPWLARRRFERERFGDLLLQLAWRIRGRSYPPLCPSSLAARLPVGLLGIGAATAFGGFGFADRFEPLDFVELYPVRGSRELQLALPELEPRSYVSSSAPPRGSLATVFVGEASPESAAQRVWEHWLRGGNALVLWNDAELEARPAERARLVETVRRIRALDERFPYLAPPTPPLTALVQDADSIALSWLKDALLDGPTWPRRRSAYQEQHGTRERGVRAWIRQLEDRGVLPACVPLQRLPGAGAFQVLVLPHVTVLGDPDVEVLEKHLQLGRTLVIEGELGWVDRSGKPRSGNVLHHLQALAPERVLCATAQNSGVLDRVVGFEPPSPRFSGDAATVPWCIAWRSTAPGSCGNGVPLDSLLVLLPKWDLPELHERFPEGLALDIEAPEGMTMQPIYPKAGVKLPRGDAAVYVVRYLVEPKRKLTVR